MLLCPPSDDQLETPRANRSITPRNDRYAKLTTLDENTSYTLSIVATNWIGSSKKSAQASFRTPKKPIYLRVWVAGKSHFRVIVAAFQVARFRTN